MVKCSFMSLQLGIQLLSLYTSCIVAEDASDGARDSLPASSVSSISSLSAIAIASISSSLSSETSSETGSIIPSSKADSITPSTSLSEVIQSSIAIESSIVSTTKTTSTTSKNLTSSIDTTTNRTPAKVSSVSSSAPSSRSAPPLSNGSSDASQPENTALSILPTTEYHTIINADTSSTSDRDAQSSPSSVELKTVTNSISSSQTPPLTPSKAVSAVPSSSNKNQPHQSPDVSNEQRDAIPELPNDVAYSGGSSSMRTSNPSPVPDLPSPSPNSLSGSLASDTEPEPVKVTSEDSSSRLQTIESEMSSTVSCETVVSTKAHASTSETSSTSLTDSESESESYQENGIDIQDALNIGINSNKYVSNDTLQSETNVSSTSESYDLKNVSQARANQSDTIIDECHFMSFEEWKKNKEESEIIIHGQNSSINNDKAKSLDTSKNKTIPKEGYANSDKNSTKEGSSLSKYVNITLDDQEGKVYKDRFNYASVDCAATIVKSNSEAKGASAILVENKDSYLLNQCSSPNKFVVIELCQDILVESVVMGNFEFFSSMFKDIKVSVSDRFPTTNWKVLGEFEAQNVRDIQSFRIENPLIWARYLKLEILSHYGSEFYCPISLVRVHGKTMMEEFKEEEAEKERQEQENEQDIIVNTQAIEQMTNEKLSEECRVILPHLDLNNFLQELNTTQDYCEAILISEPEHTTSSATTETKTEESIYRNIMKRLSLLESNATLSLLYIEEQSKLLSTAFSNLERRQSNNFESLIESVNSTIFDQLLNFKSSYINLHKEYAKLFRLQESHHEQVLKESKSRIAVISNDLTFQKRVTIFNTILILCLLVYVIVTRDIYSEEIKDNNDKPKRSSKLVETQRPRSAGMLAPKVKQHVRSKKN